MIGYKSRGNNFSYPISNEHYHYTTKGENYNSQLMIHNGGIREGWKKFTKFMKNIGPKIVKGVYKTADWLSDTGVGKTLQKGIEDTTGVKVPIDKALQTVKDIQDKDYNKVAETGLDLFKKWKDNRDKVNKSNLPEADKKEVNDTTEKLLNTDIKEASGLGKNAIYANLVNFKKGRLGNITYGVPMKRLEAIGEIKRPLKIAKRDAGRLFATGSFGGALDPKFVVSAITKDGNNKEQKGKIKGTRKLTAEEEFDKIFGK